MSRPLALVSLAAVPVAVGAFFWHGVRARRAFWTEIDPFAPGRTGRRAEA